MTKNLTEENFARHLNTKFCVNVDSSRSIELELVEVRSYAHKGQPGEQSGLERFSVFFKGPATFFLPQATYALVHKAMGEFKLFIVPIGRNESCFQYEAVFNYQK